MTRASESAYESVIGLEVHTHLRTESKLFSPAPVRYGDPPNHDVDLIDLGLPGVLPVLNEAVVELAIRLGLAIHATVHPRSVFARKNYFYPDLPKGYQISQFEDPIVSDGWIEIEVPDPSGGGIRRKRIGVTRAHLEEDAGKSIHDDALTGSHGSQIDLNRCGVPLLEIVSEPDLRSASEAGAYLRALHAILRYTEVSEANLEQGQFRCDANVSIRPMGREELGVRTELKNINSFRFVEGAIEAEIERQIGVLESGGEIVQCTMGYDPKTRRTRVLRIKETSSDYRYFPDPDLIPLQIPEERIEAVRERMPELPEQRDRRFESDYGISEYEARQLTANRALADFFEAALAARGDSPQGAGPIANWILRDLLQALGERDVEVDELAITPEALASLVGLVESGRLTARSGRELFPELVERGGDPEALMRERGLEALSDSGALETLVREVIDAHRDAVDRYRAGDRKVLNFLMGQVMQRTQGKADPAAVRRLLAEQLEA